MRVTKYNAYLDSERIPFLVKEKSEYKPQFTRLDSPEKIFWVCTEHLHLNQMNEEYFYMLAFHGACKLIGYFELSHGSKDMSIAGMKEIMLRILLSGASSIAVAHNHPSGDVKPSAEDLQVTESLKKCCELFGVKLMDHLIVGDGYSSMRSDGNIN